MKRVTSAEVAKAAGVSRTTVSLVLNNVEGANISQETRKRVIEVARSLGYVPDAAAQALARQRAQIVGLLLTRNPHSIASDGFLTQTLDGLIGVVHQHNLRLLFEIVEPRHQRQAYLQLARSKRIDGILLCGPRFEDDALQALLEDGFPTVLMGQVPGMEYYCVDVDNCAASRMAVEHLQNLGHRRIACITNALPEYTAASERLAGYRQALENAGEKYDPSLVRYGDYTLHSGYTCMKSLLQAEAEFSAVFVASDEVAIGAKTALQETGSRVPEDIALVGFDDLPLANYLEPPLTTVHLPAAEIARLACNMLLSIMQGQPPETRQVILDAHLVVRESCGAKIKAQNHH